MNSQERDVISGIFERLKSVADAPRDPEAERFIAELVARQPYAPYALAQAVYVQEQALREINDKVRDLEEQVKAGGNRSGSFLGSLFGAGSSDQAPTQPTRTSVPQAGMGSAPQYGTPPQSGGGWGQSVPQQFPPQQFPPAGQQPGSGGGGFLQGALGAAAGVAGGALLYQGLKGLFGGGEAPHAGSASGFGDPNNFLRASSSRQDDHRDDHRDDRRDDRQDNRRDDGDVESHDSDDDGDDGIDIDFGSDD
jgi:hypothetical protein